MTFSCYDAHPKPLFNSLKILKVDVMVNSQILKPIFSAMAIFRNE